MYDLDVIFLLLSSARSRYFNVFLGLYDATASAGFHTAIATNPSSLAIVARRPRIIVVDGNEDCDFDMKAVLAHIGRLDDVRTVLLADMDMCLSMSNNLNEFWRILTTLANDPRPGMTVGSDRRFVASNAFVEARAIKSVSEQAGSCTDAEMIDNAWVRLTNS